MSANGANFTVSKYVVQLFMLQGSKTKYLKSKIVSTPTTTLKITTTGRYRVKYALRVSSGLQSKLSPFSAIFRKR